jgi:hypothetical protein
MLNFDNGTNPLQAIKDGYKERGTSKPFEIHDEIASLRKMYDNDPNSLSSVQLLTLGMANLSAKNNQDSEDRRIDADKGGEGDSEDKSKADALEAIKAEIAALNTRFAELNGGE